MRAYFRNSQLFFSLSLSLSLFIPTLSGEASSVASVLTHHDQKSRAQARAEEREKLKKLGLLPAGMQLLMLMHIPHFVASKK